MNECSFKPNINHKTLSHREEAETIKDKETLRFIKRISEAKKTKEEKNARLCPDISNGVIIQMKDTKNCSKETKLILYRQETTMV